MDGVDVMMRDLVAEDLPDVMRLNRANVPAVGVVDHVRLAALLDWSCLAIGAFSADGHLAAFVICLAPGASYDSPNYRFFESRYADHVYVDRIAVGEAHQGLGLGGRLYDEVERRAADAPVMTAEVNLVPPNPGSMRFHERRGFRQVGVMENESGSNRVRLLAVDLPRPAEG